MQHVGMNIADKSKLFNEVHRVLKPGGRVAAITYSTSEENKFFSIPVSIIRKRAQRFPRRTVVRSATCASKTSAMPLISTVRWRSPSFSITSLA
jgi:ubiquinone/menaquinone biosynthesis C-methylase UbiE